MSRFRLIQPHLEKNRPLQLVAADGKLPFRTAQRWVSQYRKFGLIALVRKSRDDRGARRVVSPKIKAAIEALALESPPLPVRSICRQVRQLRKPRASRCHATERFTTSFVRFQSDCLPWRIVAERHTAKSLTWFIGPMGEVGRDEIISDKRSIAICKKVVILQESCSGLALVGFDRIFRRILDLQKRDIERKHGVRGS
jgi:hypothetical protein